MTDSGSTVKLVEEGRIHGSVYTDQALFELEYGRIWHRTWVYVAHETELREPGDYRSTMMGRQPVIVSRSAKGDVHVLLNRCRHRAATVCQAEAGNSKFFRCAYHGWTYANDGRLLGLTQAEGFPPSLKRDELGLTPVPRVSSYRGFIFASLSEDVPPLEEHLGRGVLEQLDLFSDTSPTGMLDVSAGSQKYSYAGNWKFQAENVVDHYHPLFVHASVMEAANQADDEYCFTRDFGNGHSMVDWRPWYEVHEDKTGQVPDDPAYVAALEARHGPERAKEILRTGGGTQLLIFPNLCIIDTQIRVIRPVATNATEVYVYPVHLEDIAPEINAARLRAHEGFYGPAGGGSPDDVEMFARNQLGLQADLDPYLILERGIDTEFIDENGFRSSHGSSELPQRAFWRRWAELMEVGDER